MNCAHGKKAHEPPFRPHDMRGTVGIAVSYTVLGYFLPELLVRFRATYPFIEFDLRDMERADTERAVLDGDGDIGVLLLSNSTG